MKLEERTFGTPCNQAEVWNYVKPFLLNVFAAVGSSDMRIRFKLKKTIQIVSSCGAMKEKG